MKRWTRSDIASQRGRTAVVTGTGGLGFETALALAAAGAEVIIAGRNSRKGVQAIADIRKSFPAANVKFEQLDLASLSSVAEFGVRVRGQLDKLDLLINNAAVMTPPKRETTADGFELQFGTNYLGHFAVTAVLLPLLINAKDARVVSLSSIAARDGKIDFDDLQSVRKYSAMGSYCQSKIACLMFAFELQRRSDSAGWGITSIAAHPGISRTELLHNAPGRGSIQGLARTYLWFLFQPAPQGALPTLFASTSPNAKGGAYYGPDGIAEIRGYPTVAQIPIQALDTVVTARLWDLSENLVGLKFYASSNSVHR